MSFLDQMKVLGLIDLSLILILASNSKGDDWTVNVPRSFSTTRGSDVTIPCTFTYPAKYRTKDVKVCWKTHVESPIKTSDNNLDAFVFHPNDSYVLERYRGKTKLTGNKDKGECSLQIQNFTDNELKIYLRVFGSTEKYSFIANSVFISVSGPDVTPFTAKPDIASLTQPLPISETTTNGLQSASMYTAIFVPVAVLLIIIFVAGIVCYRRHKRSQSFTREESGYYANFSRASPNQAEREASCKKQGNKKLPEVKAIDEPIYINTEAPPGQMDQSMDHMDNVYANVDYTK